jgi:hypothetical protein
MDLIQPILELTAHNTLVYNTLSAGLFSQISTVVIDDLSKANHIAHVFWLTSIPREVTAGINLSRRLNTTRSRVISSRFFYC